MTRIKAVAALFSLLLVASVALAGPVAAQDAVLAVNAVQDPANGEVTVMVVANDDPVEDAELDVTSNEAYEGNGTHYTDADGEVVLPEPSEVVDVTMTAIDGNDSVEETFTLYPSSESLEVSVEQDEEQNVLVNVAFYGEAASGANVSVAGNYTGAGDYVTDEDGTVELPAPEWNTSVTVTAEYMNQTEETSENLTAANEQAWEPFGLRLSSFVHAIQTQDMAGPMGQVVSDFVHENNPASADDDAGDAGPPEHAGPDSAGPPEHANGQGNGATVDSNGTDVDATTNSTDGNVTKSGADDKPNGPPDDAGPSQKEDEDKGKNKHNGPPSHVNNS